MQQPATEQHAVQDVLDAALAHARAAGALARLASNPAADQLTSLADALADLADGTDAAAPERAAAELVAMRLAAGAPMTTHTLRLVADALSSTALSSADGERAATVTVELRRAATRTPLEQAPLATAFSGLALLTRALAARSGRDFSLAIDTGDILAASDQLDQWRHAALQMAEFILDRADDRALSVELVARAHAGGVSLSARLPAGLRIEPARSLADALLNALEDETAEPVLIDVSGEFAGLEAAAAALGGSVAIETLPDAGQRLVLLGGRPSRVRLQPRLRVVTASPVRRAARSAA